MEDTILNKAMRDIACRAYVHATEEMYTSEIGNWTLELALSALKDFDKWYNSLDLKQPIISEAHSSLIVDFENPPITIEEAAREYASLFYSENMKVELGFIAGAKSEAAKQYWYKQFLREKK